MDVHRDRETACHLRKFDALGMINLVPHVGSLTPTYNFRANGADSLSVFLRHPHTLSHTSTGTSKHTQTLTHIK